MVWYTYYTQNAHGDVVNLTDTDGIVIKTYKYDAFGVEKNIDDADTNAYDYYINDPWESNIGSNYTRQYEEIVDGSSTGIDSGRWEESVYASWYN